MTSKIEMSPRFRALVSHVEAAIAGLREELSEQEADMERAETLIAEARGLIRSAAGEAETLGRALATAVAAAETLQAYR